MGPTIKKRKIIDGNASQRAFHQNLNAFTKVTKPGRLAKVKKENVVVTKSVNESDSEREHKKPSVHTLSRNSRKRSREEDTDTEEIRGLSVRSINLTDTIAKDGKKQEQRDQVSTTPSKSRKKARLASEVTLAETPTKGARTFLESFAISSPRPTSIPSRAKPSLQSSAAVAPSSCAAQDEAPISAEHQDLVDLHNAFLNALSLHYAHNGTASPASLRHLIPNIERRWGKRRITTEDIQRLVAIEQLGLGPDDALRCVELVDHGSSKVCIEYKATSDPAFLVESLRRIFTKNIQKTDLLGEELPFVPITPFLQEERVLSKGAQRLAELKAGAVKAQASAETSTLPKNGGNTQWAKPDNRAISLIERIRMKELHAASLPAPPSAASLARQSALMRLEEVIPVLEILSGSSSSSVTSRNLYSAPSSQASLDALMKPSLSGLGASLGLGPIAPAKVVSFTLGNIVQHLQNSLKHPIARDEAERCVRLLSTEVAPSWVGIREVGKVIGITFRDKIGRSKWMGRLKELLEGE